MLGVGGHKFVSYVSGHETHTLQTVMWRRVLILRSSQTLVDIFHRAIVDDVEGV